VNSGLLIIFFSGSLLFIVWIETIALHQFLNLSFNADIFVS